MILTIDLGTTNCKSAIWDDQMNMLSCAAEELPLITLSDNIIEQDANTMWESALRTAKTALQAENVSPMQIEAVSISSQGISLIPVSYEGNTLYNAISWLDTRATNETEALIDRYGEQKLFTQTGKRPSSLYTLPKLLWIKKHHPELYHKTWKFMLPMDYMLYRLCGVCATDHTMASGTMMYDIISRRWAAEMIDELGLDIEKLPEILEAGAPIGTVRPEIAAALGLRRDVTVGVGGQDQKCAALGAGLDRNMASASLGTGCCISALYMKPCLDPYRRIPCFAYLNDAQWVLEGVLNTAGACYEWFRNNFAPQYTFAELNKLACETSGPAREMFFPYLAGGSSPRWGSPTGTFTGLSLYSNLGNMARSVLEGVAYGICENLRVINSLGANIESLKLFGGGADSPLWCQIIADVTGLPVRTLITGETALAGAALLALRAVSRYDVPPVKEFKEYIPDKSSVRQYQEAFEQRESFTENLHLIPRAQSAR